MKLPRLFRRPERPAPDGLPRDGGPLGPFVPPDPPRDRLWLHLSLFTATFASMVLVSAFAPSFGLAYTSRDLAYAAGGDAARWADGLRYAGPFLLFLTVHEFGHYVAARRLGMSVSLPYFLPIPLPGTLGTLGAVIRIREPFRRLAHLFDVGAAGPLAGVVVAIAVFVVGALTLPGPEYFAGIPGHEAAQAALARTGALPALDTASLGTGAAVVFGETPMTYLLGLAGPYHVPGHELAHFPVLLAGWLALFFTALNLLPVGQLDGGHVVYAMFGPRVHAVVSRVTVLLMTVSAALGHVSEGSGGWILWASIALGVSLVTAKMFEGEWRLAIPAAAVVVGLVALVAAAAPGLAARVAYSGWTVWILLILFLIRLDHPFVPPTEPLSRGRRVLGVLCLVLFAMSFSVQPIRFVFAP